MQDSAYQNAAALLADNYHAYASGAILADDRAVLANQSSPDSKQVAYKRLGLAESTYQKKVRNYQKMA